MTTITARAERNGITISEIRSCPYVVAELWEKTMALPPNEADFFIYTIDDGDFSFFNSLEELKRKKTIN